MKKNLVASLGISILTLAALPQPAHAEEAAFTNTSKTTYQVDERGVTTVNEDVVLTNKTARFYAESYQLQTSFKRLYDISAYDRLGNCRVTLLDSLIKVAFNDKVVGLGATYNYHLSYKTEELTTKKGRIWEITLPKITDPSSKSSLVTLKVPLSFGRPIGLAGTSYQNNTEQEQVYVISEEALKNGSLIISFGDYQVINYHLKYHLKNLRLWPVFQEIALPPSVAEQQEAIVNSITPLPLAARVDRDGNTLAKYWLWPRQDLEIELTGLAKTYNREVNPDQGAVTTALSPYLETLLQPQPFWETENTQVKQIAMGLKSGTNTNMAAAKKIYDYVVNTLSYNLNKGFDNRLGAAAVLQNPTNAACGEFADLFVALARAAGVPTREIEGYAATNNENRPVGNDVLHSWAEFYDQAFGWIPVDPTWGNTAKTDFFTHLDAVRLILAIHGQNSDSPAPAGAYKLDINEKDQVLVTLGGDWPSNNGGEVPVLKATNPLEKAIQLIAELF
jgi:transglutaminase-like putative cysteine protease